MLINNKTEQFLFVTEPFNFFDMAVLNNLGRFHLAGDVIDRVSSLGSTLEAQSSLCAGKQNS
jgi:phosphoketolase